MPSAFYGLVLRWNKPMPLPQLVNCRDHQRDLVKLALIALGANPRTETTVLERWNTVNQPALTHFAPYASFILRVEAFLAIAHEYALISYDPNSRSDITYFHYVPFCNVFVSSDRLHLRTAKFFLEERPNPCPWAGAQTFFAQL